LSPLDSLHFGKHCWLDIDNISFFAFFQHNTNQLQKETAFAAIKGSHLIWEIICISMAKQN
jgi:hypothetical protein